MARTIALAGNPNCGKTTLFNNLTGANQYVGNWPGVTVEKKEGKLRGHKDEAMVIDLPGIYSLSPYTLEEVVTRDYIEKEKPDVIVNLLDAANLERNLYLTTQLLEFDIPVVIALNMMDVVEKRGDKIDAKKLSHELGCPVVEITAVRGKGLDTLMKTALEAADKPIAARPIVSAIATEAGITADEDEQEENLVNARYDVIARVLKRSYKKKEAGLSTSDKIDRIVTNRILALPIFALVMVFIYYISISTIGGWATDWANDGLFGDGFHLFGNGSAAYGEVSEEYEISMAQIDAFLEYAEEQGIDIEAVQEQLEVEEGEEADESVFDNFLAQPDVLALTVSGEYENEDGDVTEFVVTAAGFAQALEAEEPDPADYGWWVPGIPVIVEDFLVSLNCADWLVSLVIDGVIAGVGAVLGFVPQMIVLFFLLSILEDCGYMARVAFIMDRIFRKFGLSGKSFIPMLISSGCAVPGIMATKTIENEKDRRMTIITTSFIPCGAKLPVIALMAGVIGNMMDIEAWWLAPATYFLGVAAVIVSGIILKKTKRFAGEPAPFIMELPPYHLPAARSVVAHVWERVKSFIVRAGTIIFLASAIIWFLTSFGFEGGFGMVEDIENSLIASMGQLVSWIFIPLGFGDWKYVVATISGLIAKENVLSTLAVIFKLAEDTAENDPTIIASMSAVLPNVWAAVSFLVFNMLCAPCFAAIGSIRRQMNSASWTLFAVAYQCGFAYVLGLIIYQLGSFFTGYGFTIGTAAGVIALIGLCYFLFRKNKYLHSSGEQLKSGAAA